MNFYKNNQKFLITILILAVIALTAQHFQPKPAVAPVVEIPAATSTEPVAPVTHSNGVITFEVPENYGLALNKEQILVQSYIPSCDDAFDYCLYYNGTKYSGTNFGGAGLRIKKRDDLKTVATCLNTSPANYTGLKSKVVASTTLYTIASFAGIGDAGMGHSASGELYRLAYDGTCHEFETRVSMTQFANYPEGSIKEFSGTDKNTVLAELKNLILNVKVGNGEKLSF